MIQVFCGGKFTSGGPDGGSNLRYFFWFKELGDFSYTSYLTHLLDILSYSITRRIQPENRKKTSGQAKWPAQVCQAPRRKAAQARRVA